MRELGPGDLLDGRFEIAEEVARSGMATVYKGRDAASGRAVAVKVPFFQYESDPAFHSRFEREERIGLGLDHPGFVKMIPVAGEKSRPYIVMEFLEGQTLDRASAYALPVAVGPALEVGIRLCDALDYLHGRNVVHRDLKPQNVMVCADGRLCLFDLGIAKAAALPRLTFGRFTPTMGTPDYIAPEQVTGGRGDPRSDVYSLGVILFEMLTGRLPFTGDNYHAVMNARLRGDPPSLRSLNREIPPAVEEIVLRALERDPEDRYPTAAAFRLDLEAPENVEVTGRAERRRVPPPAVAGGERRALLFTLAAPLVAVAVAGAFLLLARCR